MAVLGWSQEALGKEADIPQADVSRTLSWLESRYGKIVEQIQATLEAHGVTFDADGVNIRVNGDTRRKSKRESGNG